MSERVDRLIRGRTAGYKHVQGGGVPGGHNVIYDGKREPFITPMTECNSIPLRHSDVVVDLGAYVGTYALRCARFPVKHVRAYEPTPSTFDILSLSPMPNLELVNAAVVADDRKSVNLFVSHGIGVTNSVVLSKNKDALEVPAVRYEEAVRGASIVKIDVEGAEYTYPIIQESLRAIILDLHPIPGRDWITRARELIAGFEAAGFRAVITPDFTNGWTRAGSWLRDRDTAGEHASLMAGKACCGCGKDVAPPAPGRTLCAACWELWRPKHREGFQRAAEEA